MLGWLFLLKVRDGFSIAEVCVSGRQCAVGDECGTKVQVKGALMMWGGKRRRRRGGVTEKRVEGDESHLPKQDALR